MAKDNIGAKYEGVAKSLVRKERESKKAESRRRNRERQLGSNDVMAQNRNYALRDQNFSLDSRASDRIERNRLNDDLVGPPGANVRITATEFRTQYPERVADIVYRPGRPYMDYVDPVYGDIRPEPPINRFKVQGWDRGR